MTTRAAFTYSALISACVLIMPIAVWGHSATPISSSELSATVKALASDEFEGRAPGSPGEAKTVDYLIARFKAMGLDPGGENGSWTQSVPLVHTQVADESTMSVALGSTVIPLTQLQDIHVATLHPVDRVNIHSAPLVFVGYGVEAPARQWDDFKDVDLKGKVAVILVNDPDFEAQSGEPVAGRFGGKAMTYFGRWTYKFEEAARHGAIGALIVHETPAAGYGWSTVIAAHGEAYDVHRVANGPQPLMLQGWLQNDAAVNLFAKAGLDFEVLKINARKPDFHPVPLGGETFTADLTVSHSEIESRNVLAKLSGTKHPDQTILYAAHWDAYGIGSPDVHGDRVRHGANDDGLGVAGVLAIARAFKSAPRERRTVVFALWTAEERGLLGSETYALHPLYPLATTAANFTMDILNTVGPSRDVVLVGTGQNSLENDLSVAAAAQGRTVTPDPHPEKGLVYRADHFSLSKRGVPTLLLMAIGGGPNLLKGGRAAGDRWVDDYTANCYHKTCDAWNADWDLRGAVQDIELLYVMGRRLANSTDWPQWNSDSEFSAVRAESEELRRK